MRNPSINLIVTSHPNRHTFLPHESVIITSGDCISTKNSCDSLQWNIMEENHYNILSNKKCAPESCTCPDDEVIEIMWTISQ